MSCLSIVVLGCEKVGKSSLIYRIITDSFQEDYVALCDAYRKEIEFQGAPLDLEIFDTATDRKIFVKNESIQMGDGFFLVFDITNRESFKNMKHIKHAIDDEKGYEQFALVLLGNKCDKEEERKIATSEAEALATEWGCHFLETSAKTGVSVNEALMLITMELKKINKITRRKNFEVEHKPCCFIL